MEFQYRNRYYTKKKRSEFIERIFYEARAYIIEINPSDVSEKFYRTPSLETKKR